MLLLLVLCLGLLQLGQTAVPPTDSFVSALLPRLPLRLKITTPMHLLEQVQMR